MNPATPRDAALAEIAELILRIGRDLEPHGPGGVGELVPLTGTDAAVMRWIHRAPDTTPAATAAGTGLQRSNLSAALKSLVAKGMVEKRPDPDDGRSVRLCATPLAEDNITRLREFWAGRLRDALSVEGGSSVSSDADLTTVASFLGVIDDGVRLRQH